MKKLQEVRGFVAFVLHPPNGYLQPICTLVLALAVMSVGATTAREASLAVVAPTLITARANTNVQIGCR